MPSALTYGTSHIIKTSISFDGNDENIPSCLYFELLLCLYSQSLKIALQIVTVAEVFSAGRSCSCFLVDMLSS